ncbi:MAG TPA: hypothetical protein VES64_10295, partial [Allosphingosinicella sp.]|nr:hypothetical protein [Allosphingosinicella sp.]
QCVIPEGRRVHGDTIPGTHCRPDGGCMHWLFLSQLGGTYRLAWSEVTWSALPAGERGPIIVFTRHSCASTSCQFTLIFNGRAIVRGQAFRP